MTGFTKTKRKTVRNPNKLQLAAVAEFLEANDKSFWITKARVADVLDQCPVAVSAKMLRTMASQFCRFFLNKNIRRRSMFKEVVLDDTAWDRLKMIATKEVDILNEPDSTFEFCLLYLRSLRAPVISRFL